MLEMPSAGWSLRRCGMACYRLAALMGSADRTPRMPVAVYLVPAGDWITSETRIAIRKAVMAMGHVSIRWRAPLALGHHLSGR
jgi:hypothetical protein